MSEKSEKFKEVDIVFNNGMSVHCSSIYSDWRNVPHVEQTLWTSYTEHLKRPSDLVDLTPFIPTSVMPVGIIAKLFQNENNQKDFEYFATDEYTEASLVFKNHANYLWGSFETGGVFMFKRTENTIDMYIQNGFFKNESNNKYFLDIGYLGNYNRTTLSRVMFFYDAWSKFNNTSWSDACYYKMQHKSDNDIDLAELVHSLDADAYVYRPNKTMQDLASCDVDYRGFIGEEILPRPVWLWKRTENRDFFGPSNLDNYTKVSGSPQAEEIDWEDEPYADDGFNVGGGGGGRLDHQSDEDDASDSSSIGTLIAQSGLVKIYNPTVSELSAFNNYLFSGLAQSVVDTLKKLTSEPMNYIISLSMYHFSPTISVNEPIKFGGIDTGVTSAVVSSTTKMIDCGSIQVPTQFKTFLDYSPYSEISIFLPYVGVMPLNQDEIIGSSIKVVYNVDIISGAGNCEVHISRGARSSSDDKIRRVLYTFGCNCSLQLPMSSLDQRGLVESIMNVASGIISGASTGGVGGAVLGGVSSIAGSLTSEKQTVHRGSGIGSNIGYLGKQKPYLILTRPITCNPIGFGSFEGWTSNIKRTLSTLTGYTEIDSGTLWVDSFDGITTDEMDMLKQITSSGFYL